MTPQEGGAPFLTTPFYQNEEPECRMLCGPSKKANSPETELLPSSTQSEELKISPEATPSGSRRLYACASKPQQRLAAEDFA